MMRFGFDIDDTLIDLRGHALSIYNRKLKKAVEPSALQQLNTLEIHSLYDLTDDEGFKMWNQHQEEIFFTNCKAFPGALELLQKLAEMGHEIFYITARGADYCQQTKVWMKQFGFPIEEGHFFCGMKDHEKVNIIKDLQLDYYVDDKPQILQTLKETKVTCLLKDQSYNQAACDWERIKDWQVYLRNTDQ